jgi:hypothetical protein
MRRRRAVARPSRSAALFGLLAESLGTPMDTATTDHPAGETQHG